MQHLFSQRVAVVTGASSGIGAATARALATSGAAVALLARRTDRIIAIARDIELAGGRVLAFAADVTDLSVMEQIAQRVRDELGRVDILINNAGVMLSAPFAQQLPQEWRVMVETNLFGVFSTTQAFLPQLLEGGGNIINIASVSGRRAVENYAVYNATKFGIVGWSDALRMELAERGVRVTVVEPGFVATELQEHTTNTEMRTKMEAAKQVLDPMHPDDIAQVIIYALSLPKNVCLNEILLRPTKEK